MKISRAIPVLINFDIMEDISYLKSIFEDVARRQASSLESIEELSRRADKVSCDISNLVNRLQMVGNRQFAENRILEDSIIGSSTPVRQEQTEKVLTLESILLRAIKMIPEKTLDDAGEQSSSGDNNIVDEVEYVADEAELVYEGKYADEIELTDENDHVGKVEQAEKVEHVERAENVDEVDHVENIEHVDKVDDNDLKAVVKQVEIPKTTVDRDRIANILKMYSLYDEDDEDDESE